MFGFGDKCITAVVLVFALALIAGCSGQPRLGIVARDEKVAIAPPPSSVGDAGTVSNQAILSDAKTGAGAGALTGAAWGLSCGPLAIFCAPIGALAGAVAGGSTGAMVGVARGLPDEQAQQITANMTGYMASQDPSEAMYQVLLGRASREWTVAEWQGDGAQLGFAFKTLGLKSQGRDKVSLTITLEAKLTYPASSRKTTSRKATFEYVGPPEPTRAWIENHGDFIAHRFMDGYLTLSENIVAAMKSPH